MPINTHSSGIRVTTNIAGQEVDNDSYVASKAAYEHNQQSMPSPNPWSTSYQPSTEPHPTAPVGEPIPDDDGLRRAVNNNLKRLGIHHQ
jgi:hypothetical protein